jgi:hypothetical protein
MNKHIFVSYARLDGEGFIQQLYADLTGTGFSIWLDIYSISGGEDWEMAIRNAVMTARAMVVVLTPGAILSLQVKGEWNAAVNYHLPIIPLLVKDCDIPFVLNVLNWIDFRHSYETGLATLRNRLISLNNDHLKHLKETLRKHQGMQDQLDDKTLLDYKIKSLQNVIQLWEQLIGAEEAVQNVSMRVQKSSKSHEVKILTLVSFRQQLFGQADIDY